MSRYKSKRSNATDFTKNVKIEMLRRDGYRCIFCGTTSSLTPAHYISRANGGLGIEENGACVCVSCHQLLDGADRENKTMIFKQYLNYNYPDFKDTERIYKKGESY